MLIDTHCHIHSDFFKLDPEQVLLEAQQKGVKKLICVGVGVDDSKKAVLFAQKHDGVFASVATHPHSAKDDVDRMNELESLLQADKGAIAAIGETGLDYFYEHSPRAIQQEVLQKHLELAVSYKKPCIFHIRGSKTDPDDAFRDFFAIFDKYTLKPSVVHSFNAGQRQLDIVLSKSLCVGVNGISTFTKNAEQIEMFRNIPLNRLVLETDAPLLTPIPKRGKINVPAYVEHTLEHLAKLKRVKPEVIAQQTTQNAEELFQLSTTM